MKKRVAKKIHKHKDRLKYKSSQIQKAEVVVAKHQTKTPENKPASNSKQDE
jgi:hypothetical protein